DYLARVTEFRAGLPWLEWGLAGGAGLSLDRRGARFEDAQKIHQWVLGLEAELPRESSQRPAGAENEGGADTPEDGAAWTYLTTDQPFGSLSDRIRRGVRRKFGR